MIEKLDISYVNNNGFAFIHPSDFDELQDKINEIIDHLPQEKECICEEKGSGIMKQNDNCPIHSKPVFLERFCNCPICQGGVKRCEKQPTKEVPDIRGIIYSAIQQASMLGSTYEDSGMSEESYKKSFDTILDQAIQEISALYRKENV